MTAIPSKVGLVLLGIYWFGMTALVVNNFTRTNNEEVTHSSLVSYLRINHRTSYPYSIPSYLPTSQDGLRS